MTLSCRLVLVLLVLLLLLLLLLPPLLLLLRRRRRLTGCAVACSPACASSATYWLFQVLRGMPV
jgi:hypothetical protein